MPRHSRILTAKGLGYYVTIPHGAKRLEFRIDPSDRATLSTRIDELIDAMADVHRINRDVFRRKTTRDEDLLFAQQVTWYILRNRWGLPSALLSSYFEHERTTITHGYQNCVDAYETDQTFRRYIDLLPFYLNIDIACGRVVALQGLLTIEGHRQTDKTVKTPLRARKGAKNGIGGHGGTGK